MSHSILGRWREVRYSLGDPLVDSYLAFVAGRCRANTLRAVAHDLETFFSVVEKAPVDVVASDVFASIAEQRGDRTVVRIGHGESRLSARTIARRLSSISGLYAYLVARGDTAVTANPVPRGLSTRRRGGRRREVPLVRVPRTLPKILSPGEVTALLAALRTGRDRAMVLAMVLGGLRRCEVLGLRLHPHRLRHTLANQAINPGMRLAGALPAEIETNAMARLRHESHARMLGNGMCTRPVELDCRMETICETCAFFDTGPEFFVPVLLRQREHAQTHHQPERANLYNNLIERAGTAP